MTAGSLLALLTPLVLKWLIDQVLPQRETGLLFLAAVLIFFSYQGRTVLTSLGNYLTLTAAQKMALRLRMNILRHLDRLLADYYESTPPGAVMYPLKEPIEEVAYFGSDRLLDAQGSCVCQFRHGHKVQKLSKVDKSVGIDGIVMTIEIEAAALRLRYSTPDEQRTWRGRRSWAGSPLRRNSFSRQGLPKIKDTCQTRGTLGLV